MDNKNIENQTKKTEPISKTEVLTSGTMGELNGQRVGCDDIGIDKYTLPNGETKEGMTAMLSVGANNWITVGVGSEIEVNESNWKIVKIDGEDVYLEKLTNEE